MAILDAAVSQLSINQAITATAVSTGTFDTAGLGIGQPVTNLYGIQGSGSPVSFGQDVGGGGPLAQAPQLGVWITTTFTAGGSATLVVQLQAAVDVNNTGNPTTWDTIMQSGVFPVAGLVGNAAIALCSFTIPDRFLGQAFPRFYRLNYVVASGPFTAGAVSAGFLTGIDDVPFYGSRY
jgi:Bbp16-like protein